MLSVADDDYFVVVIVVSVVVVVVAHWRRSHKLAQATKAAAAVGSLQMNC